MKQETNHSPVDRVVDYMVCTVAKQKLCLHITLGTRYHALCTQLLQQRGGFQRVLKITADGHDADVKISDAKRAKKLRVCTVANLCVGDIWQHIDLNMGQYSRTVSVKFVYRFGGSISKEKKEVDSSRFGR